MGDQAKPVQAPAQTAKRTFQVLAVNDERDFCECCGRTGLKKVAWIKEVETGDIKHFGTTCATAPIKGFGVDQALKAAIGRWEDLGKAQAWRAFRLYRNAGGQFGPMDRATGAFATLDKLLMALCRCVARTEVQR